MLFVNGVYVSPPYDIDVHYDCITINGVSCRPQVSLPESYFADVDDTDHDEQSRSADPHWQLTSYIGRSPSTVRIQMLDRASRLLHDALGGGETVVVFDDQPVHLISRMGTLQDFYSGLLAQQPTETQVDRFCRMAGDHVTQWRQWLQSHEMTPKLQASLQSRVAAFARTDQTNRQRYDAARRLDAMTYPLTLAGMVLGVLAMGHMMKWSAHGLDTEADGPAADLSVRYCETVLLLMLGMAAVDLVWTILAGQAGVMREMNPFAAQYLNSPGRLIVFKLAATAVGCGILYAWRRRRQMRQATWWMCLVCVLLTFRWVMFESMMS